MPEDQSRAHSIEDAPKAVAEPREIEVKLEAPPHVLRNAFALAPFDGAVVARGRTFETVYYDTADNALSRAGLMLRVRRAGRRRTLTLKWKLPQEDGPFARGEREAPIEGDAPQPEALGPDAAAMVEEARKGAALEERSRTIFRRRTAMLVAGGATIEAALDEGRIVAGERKSPIAELELELRHGDRAALFDLAAALIPEGFRVTGAPKGLRGHWLATGETPKAVRASPPVIDASAGVDDAIVAILSSTLNQFVANWAALSPERPEAVHQMRVALRRMRSALSMFNKAMPSPVFTRFREDAKRLASAMGPARDQDVLLDLVAHGPVEALGRDASFESLLKASAKKRSAAYKAVRELVESADASRFVVDLQAVIARREWRGADAEGEAVDASAAEFAAAALSRLDKRARKRGRNLIELEPEARHEVRIALKNLRYAADFFGSLFGAGKAARRFSRAVADLQDALGAYNDSIVARGIVADLEKSAGPSSARAVGAVAGWTARGAADADLHLARDWKAYRKAPRFWR